MESDSDAADPVSCATETPWPAARAVAPWIANQPAPSSLFDLLNGPLFCVEIPFTMVDGGIVPSFDDMAQEKVSYPLPAGKFFTDTILGRTAGMMRSAAGKEITCVSGWYMLACRDRDCVR